MSKRELVQPSEMPRAIARTGADIARAARESKASRPSPISATREFTDEPQPISADVDHSDDSELAPDISPDNSERAQDEHLRQELMRRPGVRVIEVRKWW